MKSDGECVPVRDEADIVVARQRGRSIAEDAGFTGSDLTIIATAISELARNIVDYTAGGEICVSADTLPIACLQIVARDRGPGIPNVKQAMMDGFSTGGGLGLGLPGVKRLMDEFQITSVPGEGTTVTASKRLRQ